MTWGAWGSFSGMQTDGSDVVGLTAGASNALRCASPSFPADQSATITLTSIGGVYLGCMVRIQGAADTRAYQLQTNGNTTDLVVNLFATNGSDVGTQLGATITTTHGTGGSGAMAIGDTIGLQIVGTTLTIFVNGISETTRTDATLASGQPGIYIYSNNGQRDFSATSIP